MSQPDFLRRCSHWIFDLDGTLTKAVHDFDHIRRELAIPDDEDILDYIDGLPSAERIEKSKRLDELEHFYALQAAPAEGLEVLFSRLAERDCMFAILTRNTRDFALMSLDSIGIGDLFAPEMVLGRNEAAPKPSPEGIQKILQAWRVGAGDALMVGDFIHDLNAGRAAECRTIHVDADTSRNWPKVTDYRFRSLHELSLSV